MARGSCSIPSHPQPHPHRHPADGWVVEPPRCGRGRAGVRLPGLFRLREIDDALAQGGDFHRVKAGASADGDPLFAVYYREA